MSKISATILENAEMTKSQLEFVCRLLEENKPHKIVEVGIAAGGTSVVIINKINSLNLNVEMYSVDLSKEFYRDKTKETGYLIDEYLNNNEITNLQYTKLLGDYAINFLNDIGNDIDFLILDTVHSLPGEILDFLAFVPYLKNNAIVVVHDIVMNHLSDNQWGFATQVLLDCVVADKLTPIECGKEYPDIGAFRINHDTKKYLDDVFNAMMITWNYIPGTKEVQLYRSHYERHFSRNQLHIFDEAVKANQSTYNKIKENEFRNFGIMYKFVYQLNGKKVFIYGKGYYGQKIKKLLEICGISVEGFIVSLKDVVDKDVFTINEFANMNNKDLYDIVIGVSTDKQKELISNLENMGFNRVFIPSEEVLRLIP